MATNDKYDRQLRLWGAEGQEALGNTCVVLIGATAAGTETLKNLVLPGVGAFLVVDEGPTTSHDASSNFFLTHDPTNPQDRAEVAHKLLSELNPDVHGSHRVVDSLASVHYSELLKSTGKHKVFVVTSDVIPEVLDSILSASDALGVPVLVTRGCGLIGTVRLQSKQLPIIQPKPRSRRPDLRLFQPFPALQSLSDSINWGKLASHEHSHVPYPLVLLRVAKEFKATKGSLPSTFAEKQAFQDMIKATSRDFNTEENFAQALKHAYLAYSPLELDLDHLGSIRDISKQCAPDLHDLLLGLDQFVTKNGVPPLSGKIPDMVSSTESYLELQNCYQEKAKEDWKAMRDFVDMRVSDGKISTFIDNVHNINLLQIRSVADTSKNIPSDLTEDLSMALMEDEENVEQHPLIWYLGVEGCQEFHRAHGRYPGTIEDYQADVPLLQTILGKVVTHYGLHENDTVQSVLADYKIASELVRFANAEIHNIASVIGGVASQEAVKVITGQYVPINNTYVYNGISSSGAVFQF